MINFAHNEISWRVELFDGNVHQFGEELMIELIIQDRRLVDVLTLGEVDANMAADRVKKVKLMVLTGIYPPNFQRKITDSPTLVPRQ